MLINITAYCSEKYKKVNRMDEKMKKTKIKFCPAQGKWDTKKGKWKAVGLPGSLFLWNLSDPFGIFKISDQGCEVESFGVWKLLDADPGCGGGVSPIAPYLYAVKTDPGITEAVIKCL